MADTRGRGAVVCNDRCGCPPPCPGGTSCRCVTSAGEDVESMEHKKCPCGEHCSCNPCSCSKADVTANTSCRCGGGCTCASCAAQSVS